MAEIILEIPLMSQERTRWCWAAVASGAGAGLHGTEPTRQCEIANSVLNLQNCCTDLTVGNTSADLTEALQVVSLESHPGDSGTFEFGDIVDEIIHRRRPVGARIVDRGNGAAHFVLIVGCDIAAKTIVASDPWGTVGASAPRYRMPFVKLKDDYGGWGACSDFFRIA